MTGSSAARGQVEIARDGRLRGRLGGRSVRARLANRPPRPAGLFAAGAEETVASVAVTTPVVARP